MVVEPRIDSIKILCFNCGKVSIINWKDVDNSKHLFDDTIGEIYCPGCKSIGTVYTREKIDLIKTKKVNNI